MPKLLLATANRHKQKEFKNLLQSIHYELVTPSELSIDEEVEEGGGSLEENATIKAKVFAARSGLLSLADDSGLEVDALDGAPGVFSSRYAGENASDIDRVSFLLSKLKYIPQGKRQAKFRCVIAIASPQGKVELCVGECRGVIALYPSGKEGFGYDPVFYLPQLGKTMAELPLAQKNKISHRAKAVAKARSVLLNMIDSQ
jgi:XTP/dITP diphosphohydrolase